MIISSAATVLLLRSASRLISGAVTPSPASFAWFVTMLAVCLGARSFSSVTMNRVWLQRLHDYRMSLAESMLCTPLQRIEQIGRQRLMTALNADSMAKFEILRSLPGVFGNGVIVVGVLCYLVLLSPAATAISMAVLCAGIAVHRLLLRSATRNLEIARSYRDKLSRVFSRSIASFADLLMNASLARATLRLDIGGASIAFIRAEERTWRAFALSQTWAQAITFGTLLVVLFGMPFVGSLRPANFAAFGLMVLYLHGPIEALLEGFTKFINAHVAEARLAALGLTAAGPGEIVPQEPPPGFRSLELRSVGFAYTDDARPGAFRIRDVSLTLQRGEVVLFDGPNGGGKTTLLKLICGLYDVQEGCILLDGRQLSRPEQRRLRELCSVTFAHAPRLARLPETAQPPAAVDEYLDRFGLSFHLSVEDGVLATNGQLSTGQAARVALLAVYLEDRPIVIFDEWAMSQDTKFRDLFYTSVIPELKNRGKLVMLVNHQAYGADQPEAIDRVIRVQGGTVVVEPNAPVEPQAAASAD